VPNKGLDGVMAVKQLEKSTARVGVTCSVNQQMVKRSEENAFNAKLELGYCREWLMRLRDEVDGGLMRIDVVLKELECSGPSQGSKATYWVFKPIKRNKPKGKKKIHIFLRWEQAQA
jgi:hypothetical protein